MNVGLIYFSQTGNTRKVAEHIAEGIISTGAACKMIHIKNATSRDLREFDLIGIGCPVFYYKEPENVRSWIESLSDTAQRNWFVFCTHGNIIGNFFPSMTKLLQGKNAVIIGYFHCYAGIRLPYLPSPGFTGGHPDDLDLSAAKDFGVRTVELRRKIMGADSNFLPDPVPVSSPEWIRDSERFTPEFLKKNMPRLIWNEDACTGCGICWEECPVNGINLEARPPRLQEPCIFCWNCVCVCPTDSIYADWDHLIAYAPTYFAICRAELEKNIEKGDFRPLIDLNSVDTTKVFINK